MQLDYTNDRQACVDLLKAHIKGDRLIHSLGVEQTAIALARRHGVNEEKAGLAGLLHDITKQMDNEKLKDRYGICTPTEKTLHGPTGAVWLKENGYIEDTDVLNAIRYHTTGRPAMSDLEKVIFLADCIEPNRTYADVEMLRSYAYEDLDKAVLFALERTLRSVLDRQILIDPDTVAAYNDYRSQQNRKKED